jgi:hypothetical protein
MPSFEALRHSERHHHGESTFVHKFRLFLVGPRISPIMATKAHDLTVILISGCELGRDLFREESS